MKVFFDGSWNTENCVRHKKRKAVMWAGHVVDNKSPKRTILAGWCNHDCEGLHGFKGFVDVKEWVKRPREGK
jgi:hypothetical protein